MSTKTTMIAATLALSHIYAMCVPQDAELGTIPALDGPDLLLFINYISHHAELKAEDGEREERWVLSVSAVSMMMGFLACFFHLIWKDEFSGSKIEGLFVSIEIVFKPTANLCIHYGVSH
jgi:hypothetical protein